MRHIEDRTYRFFAVLLLLFWILTVFGCASDPTSRWARARESLSVAQDTAVLLYETGNLSDEDMANRIGPAVLTARSALERAEQLLPDGPGIAEVLDIAEAAVLRLSQLRMEYVDGNLE
jgi:hypothetical protein